MHFFGCGAPCGRTERLQQSVLAITQIKQIQALLCFALPENGPICLNRAGFVFALTICQAFAKSIQINGTTASGLREELPGLLTSQPASIAAPILKALKHSDVVLAHGDSLEAQYQFGRTEHSLDFVRHPWD